MIVAVDIDGTLFDCRARAHLIPADRTKTENWTLYNVARHLDVKRGPVCEMVEALCSQPWVEVVMVSSVGNDARHAVINQLDTCDVPYDLIDLRPMDDHRTALDYKMDRYRKLAPDLIIEDHPGIVAALRLEGFTVLQIDSLDPTV